MTTEGTSRLNRLTALSTYRLNMQSIVALSPAHYPRRWTDGTQGPSGQLYEVSSWTGWLARLRGTYTGLFTETDLDDDFFFRYCTAHSRGGYEHFNGLTTMAGYDNFPPAEKTNLSHRADCFGDNNDEIGGTARGAVSEVCGKKGDTPDSTEKECPKKETVENGTNYTSSQTDKNFGTVWAGPGEDRRLINFDVKAFFEDQPQIKNVGRENNMSFRISGDAQIMRDILRAHGFIEMPLKSRYCNFSWIGNSISELCIDQLLCYQSINHFVGSTSLTRKDKLYKNISKMKKKKGAANFDFVPTSFVLPKEMRKFKSYYKRNPGPFIVKPAGLSRGRGVYLIGKPKDISNTNEEQVVSKYINNPLLIDGYKIDLRIYVLVTSYNPLVIYIYQEGLTRFATVKYKNDPNNLHVLRMHLTNFSINVSSGNYIKNEDSSIEDFGSKWTLSALLRYFHANGIDTIAVMREIEDVIIKTILSVEKPIASGCRIYQRKPTNCFELFGFDIMLDDKYKPWLLEVNLSPSLVCTTPLDIKVKGNMLCDLLNLVGIECHTKEKPKDNSGCHECFCSYIHRTVGYFCICVIRDEIRQLLLRRKKNRRFHEIMGTYKEKFGTTATELYAMERKRAKYLTKMSPKGRNLISQVKNEVKRGGGWVKIFPTIDSWQKYKNFMRYKTVRNVLLHQCLYPDQHFGLTHTDKTAKVDPPTKSEEALMQNTKWYSKAELGVGLTEMLQRLKRYQSSLEISPPPRFTVRPTGRDGIKLEEDVVQEDAKRKMLLNQVLLGYLLTEVQARIAFQRYLTNVKQCLRSCQALSIGSTRPPIPVIKDLLFRFLGQSSDLVVDPQKPPVEHTLESCLNNFLYNYHKETRQLMTITETPIQAKGDNPGKKADDQNYVSTELFEDFMHSANPWELEYLLISYLKIHGDATIFMRNRVLNKSAGCVGEQDTNGNQQRGFINLGAEGDWAAAPAANKTQ
ncbi:hypothetical protein RRG08_054637 [Elysia crispata]|uniref:Tubulin--tyrosine ligase-like protein 5 n=1 Tax=Elysia crispata TaxID=231223 RepID=A0AAE1E805_9GAST|nr:hypothetical protein RRG08_054637 [Elysia crispata]